MSTRALGSAARLPGVPAASSTAAADAAEVFIAEGMTPAMNRFNKRNSPGPEPEVEPGWLSPESN